jgi:uncharacterized protein YcfL
VGQNILLLSLLNVVFVVTCSAYHGLGVQREQSVLLREENTSNGMKTILRLLFRYDII